MGKRGRALYREVPPGSATERCAAACGAGAETAQGRSGGMLAALIVPDTLPTATLLPPPLPLASPYKPQFMKMNEVISSCLAPSSCPALPSLMKVTDDFYVSIKLPAN